MRSSQIRSMLFAALLFTGVAAHAEVVKLTGGRALRVVGVTAVGKAATLALHDGGSVTVPIATIESITSEPVTADLCAASPFRCQDRAMLLTRRSQIQAAVAAVTPHPMPVTAP